MSYIRFLQLEKKFENVRAVAGISFDIQKGDFVTFLGPSGCGKTTTLRCLSGLETPEGGEIRIGDKIIFSKDKKINVPAGDRGLGLVFQNYALWPHMTVEQNIAFGLRKMKIDAAQKEAKIKKVLDAMDIEEYRSRYPHELSGGQQQRVAVARMIVNEPDILLFDEPLSNLDAKLRMKLRSELKKLHSSLGATSIYVTHDQTEALALSDKIVVMKKGTIQQIGTPSEVYHKPANTFVADFMGNPETNLLEGTLVRKDKKVLFYPSATEKSIIELPANIPDVQTDKVLLNARPEDISIKSDFEDAGVCFAVYTTQLMGSEILIHLKSQNKKLDLIAKCPEDEAAHLKPEQDVALRVKRGNFFDTATGNLLGTF